MSKNFQPKHELECTKKESRWMWYILNTLNNPRIYQQPINRREIENCPGYFSGELRGCIPSAKWLVEMCCEFARNNRHYHDSECAKRTKSS